MSISYSEYNTENFTYNTDNEDPKEDRNFLTATKRLKICTGAFHLKFSVFLDVTLRISVEVFSLFRGSCCLQHQGR